MNRNLGFLKIVIIFYYKFFYYKWGCRNKIIILNMCVMKEILNIKIDIYVDKVRYFDLYVYFMG